MPWWLLIACTPPAPFEDVDFDVLTYNVAGLPPAVSDIPRSAEERMPEISPHLDAYDIVGLQETFDEDWHALLVAQATQPAQYHFSEALDDRVYGSGLALLARPLGPSVVAGYEAHHYTVCHGVLDGASDCLASKGFQVLLLAQADATLAVINTHHEAGGGPEDDDARAAQVTELLAWLDAHPDVAVVFMGDLNLRASDPPDALQLARYAAAGLRDACVEVGCPEPDHIDHVFVRDGATTRVDALAWSREADFVDDRGDDLSDHPAIAATLRWRSDR